MNLPQLHRPKTILMTADTIGGVWTYVVELARSLQEHEVQVFLASMGRRLDESQKQDLRGLHNVQLFESSYKLEWMEKPWWDLERAGKWLLDLEQRLQPEMVHLNNYVHGALPFQAPKLVVGHSCVLSWWQAVKGEPAPEQWNWYHFQVARGLKAAGMVIAPSSAMMDALVRHYGPLRTVEVIPNGRDPDLFRPQPKENYILAAGRLWDAAKNIETLAQLGPELPWPIYIAGDAHEPGRPGGQLTEVQPCSHLLPASPLRAVWFIRPGSGTGRMCAGVR